MKFRVKFLRNLAMAGMFMAISMVAGANPPDGVRQKAPEFSNQAFDREAALARRAEVHAWLQSEAVAQGLAAPIAVGATAEEKAEVDNAPRDMSPQLVGFTKAMAVGVSFGDMNPGQLNGQAVGRPNGAVAGTRDGGFVYTTALSSPDATALRVHFTGFNLPDGAGLYLYTESGQVFGPYTGRGIHGDGEFWSHTVVGDTVFLQLRHVGPTTPADLRNTRFTVAGLGHVRPRWLGTCSFNASCVQNANCPATSSIVDPARNAVAHMQWISGPYIYICSGGLVADQDTSSTIPYFLSANHCISRGKDARNLENFFQFDADCNNPGSDCNGVLSTRENHPQDLRTLGATIKSTNRDTDHTLFELNEMPPASSSYLGWNSDEVAFTSGGNLYRISHPGGAPQSYSEHVVDADVGTCQSWPRGDRIYSRDVYGATEGGSSGSPVVNAAGEIVGQLSGACGYNVNDSCDAVNNATVDGAFAAYFSEVAPFLTGGGSCTPSTEICDDGQDNDCDLLVDGDDPDCGGGLPPGESCSVDSECASNKCKGRQGAKTCR